MQRYLRPDLLEAAGIDATSTPGPPPSAQTVTQIEMAPEGGSSFRQKTRFARFPNVPEMLRMLARLRRHQDRRGPQAARPRPGPAARRRPARPGDRHRPALATSQLDVMAELGDRADAIRNRAGAARRGQHAQGLHATAARPPWTCACSACRMTDPGKIDAAADRIAGICGGPPRRRPTRPRTAGRTRSAAALQLVFCDLGTPGDGWNVYDELRDQLTARGVPREADPVHPRGQDRPGQGRAVRRLPRRDASPS